MGSDGDILMKRLFLILALLPLLGMGAGQSVITGHHRQVTAIPAPTAPNANCFVSDNTLPYMTSNIDTTGAKPIIVVTMSNYQIGSYTGVVDNLTSASLDGSIAAKDYNDLRLRIWQELTPTTTGSTATFTFTGTGAPYGRVCVVPIKGTSGVYDSNVASGTGTSGSTQAGSINPGSGAHMVIAAVAYQGTGTVSIDSSYTIVPNGGGTSGGCCFGLTVAYLGQSPGASTNPTWSGMGSVASAQIASWH